MADSEVLAYEMIGRAIIAWGYFEQTIIRQTWRARDLGHKFPFPVGHIERGFYKRWSEWANLHRGAAEKSSDFEAFFGRVRRLSVIRDDLAHNVFGIIQNHQGFFVQVERRNFDWRAAFKTWARRYAHRHWRARPRGPIDQEILLYSQEDIAKLIQDIDAAHAAIKRLAEALAGSRKVGCT
ncbi:MAG: hypothetical protein ACT4OG_09060 [Alphaproteobacteria bacterium]